MPLRCGGKLGYLGANVPFRKIARTTQFAQQFGAPPRGATGGRAVPRFRQKIGVCGQTDDKIASPGHVAWGVGKTGLGN